MLCDGLLHQARFKIENLHKGGFFPAVQALHYTQCLFVSWDTAPHRIRLWPLFHTHDGRKR